MTSPQWLNASAFKQNAAETFGNAGYNSLLGPGFNTDANLTRVFRIKERHTFELRFEFFNWLNHTNFNFPVARLASPAFGQIQSSDAPRILQFAAKNSF